MKVVDVHAHAMPLPVLEWLQEEGLCDLSGRGAGYVQLDPKVSGVGAGTKLPLPEAMYDVETRLANMDDGGIDIHAVSLPPFLMAPMCSDTGVVTEIVRRGNDALADYVSAAPDRLVALGTAPVGFDAAADEARRCLDELRMTGIAIGSQGAGLDLDANVNEPLWALLAERRTFTLLHPSGSPNPARTGDFWFPQLVGYPMETALAAARLVFGGVTSRYQFPLCLAHGGGCLPSLRGRLSMGWERKPQARTIDEDPRSHFGAFYYDTAVFDDDLLRALVMQTGSNHVLMGTDYPFDLAEQAPVKFVSAVVEPSQASQILGGVAAGLLGIHD